MGFKFVWFECLKIDIPCIYVFRVWKIYSLFFFFVIFSKIFETRGSTGFQNFQKYSSSRRFEFLSIQIIWYSNFRTFNLPDFQIFQSSNVRPNFFKFQIFKLINFRIFVGCFQTFKFQKFRTFESTELSTILVQTSKSRRLRISESLRNSENTYF